jgi:hypothetical protein
LLACSGPFRLLHTFACFRRVSAAFLRFSLAQVLTQGRGQALTAIGLRAFIWSAATGHGSIIGLPGRVATFCPRLASPGAVWQFPPRFPPQPLRPYALSLP